MQIFSREAAVIEMGRMMLYGYAVSMPVVGAYNIAAVLLQALGEKRSAFFLSIARQGLFYIPIIWILPSLLGKLGIISNRSTREKVLAYLSDQAALHGSSAFDIPYTRQELADALYVERSALSHELSRLQKDGYLTFSRKHFELHRLS